MTTVFIGGSRHISRLSDEIRRRLQNMIDGELRVIVGDANGADKAAQAFFAERHYPSVTVYCMLGASRNNLGAWPVEVVGGNGKRGFEFYALKDARMAEDADCGFMIWDAKSKGTISNVVRLLDAGKSSVVYFAPARECRTVQTRADLERLLRECSPEVVEGLSAVTAQKLRQESMFVGE